MRITLLFFVLLCVVGNAFSHALPGVKPEVAPMADSTGKLILMDFNIKLSGIKDANMPFSVFSSRPLLVYYYSPHCPHCQKGFPGVQQLAKEYEQKGFTSITISVGNVNRRDILMFMEQHKASIPFFQDTDQEFGKRYGDGYVPRLYLISPDGKVTRYTHTDSDGLKDIRDAMDKMLGIKK
ncbi:MAG: TlpA family protein disulfide reductase [Fibromonadales bacterium]|nr:TlpA family protein disulfide reductase [Fibromonadales bacterium]